MPYTVQKKIAGGKWENVGAREILDAAIVLATQTENHPPAGKGGSVDIDEVWARILDGKRVIWK